MFKTPPARLLHPSEQGAGFAAPKPPSESIMGRAQAHWLDIFLVRRGLYKINVQKLVSDQQMRVLKNEDLEGSSNHLLGQLSYFAAPGAKSALAAGLSAALSQALLTATDEDISELLAKGYIKPQRRDKWTDKENRVAATRELVRRLGKPPHQLTARDFTSNKLGGMLQYHYNESPFLAVSEAFPELQIQQWQMGKTPQAFYSSPQNRIAATRWLASTLDCDPRAITFDNFVAAGLAGLLAHYYNGSPFLAVSEAFPELEIRPWEMSMAPLGFYDNPKNRISAVKWLLARLGKNPRDLTVDDFNSNCLSGLLNNNYNGSPFLAISEAFPELGIREWEMVVTPRDFFKTRENRIAAVCWLIEKLGKPPRELTSGDFTSNRLSGLIRYYNGSPYRALLEAGLVGASEEFRMRMHGPRSFSD